MSSQKERRANPNYSKLENIQNLRDAVSFNLVEAKSIRFSSHAPGARVIYKPLQAAASRYKPQITRIFLSNYVTWLVAACRPPERLVFYPSLDHKPVNPSSNNQPQE